MTRLKTATPATWHTLGALAKHSRDILGRVRVLGDKCLPKRLSDSLRKATDLIDKFRSDAEDAMFARGGPKDIKVFYPGDTRGRKYPASAWRDVTGLRTKAYFTVGFDKGESGEGGPFVLLCHYENERCQVEFRLDVLTAIALGGAVIEGATEGE